MGWTLLRRTALALGIATSLIGLSPLVDETNALAQGQPRTLRAVMHADLRSIDPHWTTATITGIHGLLVYDTLFGVDGDGVPRPQMVGDYSVSPDRLLWTFTLREGLEFHDGSPVTTADVIASLRRWSRRDGPGGRLFSFVTDLSAVDARTFTMRLSEPYGLVLDTLGKSGTSVPVIMRKQEADTDPNTQITEVIGSGPFKFLRDQWQPGARAIYERNPTYRPRSEAPSGLAGGKVAKVDRVELVWIPDGQTAVQALIAGEIDYLEQPSIDFLRQLQRARNVQLMRLGSIPTHHGLIRLNHLHAPMDNMKFRQGMQYLIDQKDFLEGVIGNAEYYDVCPSMFICGAGVQSIAGGDRIKNASVERARATFREAGYTGQPITVLHATDHHTINPSTQVLIQKMREAGLTLDVQAMDWGAVVTRRARREPPAQGGWHIFVTTTSGTSTANPAFHLSVGAACEREWFGWPCDAQVEQLRREFAFATPDQRQSIADRLHARAMEVVTYLPFGQWTQPMAFRSDRVSGVVPIAGIAVFWNIERR